VLPTPVAIYIAAEVYLLKLPRLLKKLRVMVGWTLDLFFSRDTKQMITSRDVEALGQLAGPDSCWGERSRAPLFFRAPCH
jgi:hypothetical protein